MFTVSISLPLSGPRTTTAGVASFSFSADDQNCIKVIGAQRERARGRRALAVPESGTDKQNSRPENILRSQNLNARMQCDLFDCIYIKMRFSALVGMPPRKILFTAMWRPRRRGCLSETCCHAKALWKKSMQWPTMPDWILYLCTGRSGNL